MIENQTTKQRIIRAAEYVFLEKGLEDARMSDIAAKAGISRTSLNYYYRTKENLFYAIIERMFDKLLPQVEGLSLLRGELGTKIDAFVDIYFEMVRNNKFLSRVVLVEVSRKPELIYNYFNTGKKVRNYFRVLDVFINDEPVYQTTKESKAHLMCAFFGLLFTPFLMEPLLEMCRDEDTGIREVFLEEHKKIVKKLMKAYFS